MMPALGATSILSLTDILLKQHVEESIDSGEEKEFISGKIVIRKVYNKGFMLHAFERYPILIKGTSAALGICMLLYNLHLYMKKGHRIQKLGAALFTAGALSNIFDRLVRGKVIDYIGFHSKSSFLSKLTVNLADIFIVIGTLIMTCNRILNRGRSK